MLLALRLDGDSMSRTVIDDAQIWEDLYLPIPKTADESESWGGLLYETYGDDLAYVLSVANKEPRRVWTWVDAEDGSYIINGYHLVNRIGYFVTGVEWLQGDHIEVVTL